MNILFICNQGRNCGRTAAQLFRGPFHTESAGLYCRQPVTARQLAWADLIIVMEDRHRAELARRFPQIHLRKQIIALDIPDVYRHGQAELLQLLDTRMHELLEPFLHLPYRSAP